MHLLYALLGMVIDHSRAKLTFFQESTKAHRGTQEAQQRKRGLSMGVGVSGTFRGSDKAHRSSNRQGQVKFSMIAKLYR